MPTYVNYVLLYKIFNKPNEKLNRNAGNENYEFIVHILLLMYSETILEKTKNFSQNCVCLVACRR